MWMIFITALIVAVIAFDQVSKAWILRHLYEEKMTLIEGVLDFTFLDNPGMAFGLLPNHRWVFMVLSVIGIAAAGYYLYRYAQTAFARIGLALIVGGGIGNMIDRVRLGFVVDFIDFCALDFGSFNLWPWVFNVADACICVGAVLFATDLIREIVRETKKSRNEAKNEQKIEDDSDGAAL